MNAVKNFILVLIISGNKSFEFLEQKNTTKRSK
jgi:hypothetical protein